MTTLFRSWLLVATIWVLAAMAQQVGPKPARVRPAGLTTWHPATAGQMVGADFVTWVNQQVAAGTQVLAVQQGAYHVTPGGSGTPTAHIFLTNLNNVTIWMDSVNLTMTWGNLTAVYVKSSASVSLYGPTVWWDTPGFSQATITNVATASANMNITIHLDDGYDNSFLLKNGQINGECTDPATGMLPMGAGSTGGDISGPVTPVTGQANTYLLDVVYNQQNTTQGTPIPQVGWKLIARGAPVFCNQVVSSNDTHIYDFKLLNCGGFGFFSGGNWRTLFDSFQLKRAPFPPPGGTSLPARASSADGIHSAQDFVGPTFDSCYFEALDDDCIAVHGSLHTIVAMGPVPNSFWSAGSLGVGDTLRFYQSISYAMLGTAHIQSITYPGGGPPGQSLLTMDTLPGGVTVGTNFTDRNRTGSGFQVINNHMNGNRGRGAIIKASNGVINNNLIVGSTYAAIDVGPEFTYWGEGDFVSNVSITNNVIQNVGYLATATSALMVHGDGYNIVGGNSDIYIHDNTIQNVSSSNVYLGASTNVTFGRTTFQNPYVANYHLSESWPGANEAIATFQNVSFGLLGPNCVDAPVNLNRYNYTNVLGTDAGWNPVYFGQC